MLLINHGCVFKLICCIHLSIIWEEDTCTDKVYLFFVVFLFFKSICPVSLTVFPLSFLYVLTRQRPTALKPFKLLFTAMRYWGSIFAIHKVQEQAPLSKSNSFLPLSFPLSSEWYLFLHIEDSERKCFPQCSCRAGHVKYSLWCCL